MNLLKTVDDSINTIARFTKRKAPTILTLLGVTGFITTTVMVAKAAPKAAERMDDVDRTLPADTPAPKMIFEKVKAVAPIYGPAVVMGTTSILCVLKANDISNDRIAAVSAAYEFSEHALREYQDKVIETIGEKKEQSIRDEIAKDHVKETPIDNDDVIGASTGTLFMDSISKRYFRANPDDVWDALLRFKDRLVVEEFMTLDEWYYELGLEPMENGIGDRTGWNVTRNIDIYYSYQEAANGEVVKVIEYRTPPTYDFQVIRAY